MSLVPSFLQNCLSSLSDLVFSFLTFTGMTKSSQDEYLRDWCIQGSHFNLVARNFGLSSTKNPRMRVSPFEFPPLPFGHPSIQILNSKVSKSVKIVELSLQQGGRAFRNLCG